MKMKFPFGWLHPTPAKARHVGDSIFAAASSGAVIALTAGTPKTATVFAGLAFTGKFLSLLYVDDETNKPPSNAGPSGSRS